MEQLVIQSDNTGIARVEDYVSRLCDERHIGNHFGTISMAVLQAVENAMIHGNQSDATKQVVVETGDCDGGIYFSISDMGAGFDTSLYGDLPDNEGRGEGIFMMKALSDRMEYNASGNTVRLEFRIRGIDRELYLQRLSILQEYYSHQTILEK